MNAMTLETVIGQITNLVVAITALVVAVRAHAVNGQTNAKVQKLETVVNGGTNAIPSQTPPVA